MDKAGFESIYNRYNARVYNTVLSYLQHREDAEEVTQDVFVEVFRSAEQFKGEAALSTWIYRIAVNKAFDFIKHRNRQKRFAFLSSIFKSETGELQHDHPHFDHPGILLENKEKGMLLFDAIRKLSENQQTAFILFQVEGLSYKEISEIMQQTESSVESLLHRARANLRNHLEDFYKQ
jgi:RNA polymerase sigma factor (sigma-70 family)